LFPVDRYEHYIEEDDPNLRKPKRAKSQDPFADKYFEIMDTAQELNLVSAHASFLYGVIHNFPIGVVIMSGSHRLMMTAES
jgi:hypothetical protein